MWILTALLGANCALGGADDAASRFRDLYTREWTWRETQFPGENEETANRPPADHLPKVDPATQQLRENYWTGVLGELATIDENALSDEDRVNYEVYQNQIEVLREDQRLREWEMPLNSDTTFWTNLGFAARRPMATEESYHRYLAMLADVPRYFTEQIVNMRSGLKRGFSVPRVTLAGRDQSITEIIDAPGETNLFYQPFVRMPGGIGADSQANLRAEALQTIRTVVIPAYVNLLEFMRNDYMRRARVPLAAEALPDGRAYYRARIREFTTLDREPDAIHALGLKEAANIREQMQEAIAQSGFTGSFAEFLKFLRTDPKF